ncbi:MAG: type I-C CRISPR-associated protein Cas8c/Csd1 [Steroidobacteraceae bacterium]
MILQSLVDLYDRRAGSPDPADRPAPIGFESKAIAFVLEIDRDGHLVQISDMRQQDGKRLAGARELVPQGTKKTSGVAANLLWDTAEYVLGCAVELKGKATSAERLRQQHAAFRMRIEALPERAKADDGVRAVRAFLDQLDLDNLSKHPAWEVIRTTNPTMTFRLTHDAELVCQRVAVRRAWLDQLSDEVPDGFCLVSGAQAAIERVHPSIKGVWGAQTSGANIVSFNLEAFNSYGKCQGDNAPVGRISATKYTTTLNDLLARDSRQRMQVGDASTVFWAERRNGFEDDFLLLIGEPQRDDPTADIERVRSLYQSIHDGRYLREVCGDDRFFVLGLAPNAARLAVRFWHVDTVAVFVERFARWFDDVAIDHAPNLPKHVGLNRLLAASAVRGKEENIPPNLGAEVLRAVVAGTPFPQSWLQAALRRCRIPKHDERSRRPLPIIPRELAATIKACLNRRATNQEEKLTVSLDPDNNHVAYRLGRLFAVFERIQEEANPGLNSTIRDRYFGAASSNPLAVFPTLNRLKNHHLSKLDSRGRAQNLEKLVGEIVDGLPGAQPFPATMGLSDQGRFAVGYYHQRQHSSTYRTHSGPETTP